MNKHGYSVYLTKSQKDLDEKLFFLREKIKWRSDAYEDGYRNFENAALLCANLKNLAISWAEAVDVKLPGWESLSWEDFCKELGLAPFSSTKHTKCVCERQLMINRGCQCGAFQRELEEEQF